MLKTDIQFILNTICVQFFSRVLDNGIRSPCDMIIFMIGYFQYVPIKKIRSQDDAYFYDFKRTHVKSLKVFDRTRK